MIEPAHEGGVDRVLLRPRVVQRVLSAYSYPITAIVAPAGFGKTTAIRQALATIPNAISVSTPVQATLPQFVQEFARCCSDLFPAMKVPPDSLPSALDDTEQAIELFYSWTIIHLKDAKCTIAIDDIQNAKALDGVLSYVVRVVDATKNHIKWILATRTRSSLPLTRWQAYADADTPVSSDDLRLTIDEAAKLAASLNSPATLDDLQGWIDQTNGFAVPLAHAIRTSARRGTAESIMDRTRSITFDYFAEQVWSSLSGDDRSLLEIASLLPPIHIQYLDGCGISSASSRARYLDREIAFLMMDANGVFGMHDLFRDFIRQQMIVADSVKLQLRRRGAVDVLLRSQQYEAALRNVIEWNDHEYARYIIEEHNFKIADNSLIRSVVELAINKPPDEQGIKMLLLQAEFCSWLGDEQRAKVLTREILARNEATSDQILRAARVTFRSLSLQTGDERTTWIARTPQIISRLNESDKNVAEAWLSAFLAQSQETQEASRALLRSSSTGIAVLLPSARIDALVMASIAHLYLNDLSNAMLTARWAMEAAHLLGDIRELARAMNNLGIIYWNAHDAELESLFVPLREAVERSGCWAFSQVSHWLPANYYLLSGDFEMATAVTALQFEIPLLNESYRVRLRSIQRHTANLANILNENYRDVILDDRRAHRASQSDLAYELSTDAAIAYALESNFAASESALNKSRQLRPRLSANEDVHISISLFIEIACLGANGQWHQARRLHKEVARGHESLAPLESALDRFCDGPPFAGLNELLKECYAKPYIGLAAIVIKRVAERFRSESGALNLSLAEKDVLRLLFRGKSNKAIAEARNRSPETIKRQIAAIFKKLGVDSRMSAVAIAREQDLV